MKEHTKVNKGKTIYLKKQNKKSKKLILIQLLSR